MTPPTSRSATRIPLSFPCLTTHSLCKISSPITLFHEGIKWLSQTEEMVYDKDPACFKIIIPKYQFVRLLLTACSVDAITGNNEILNIKYIRRAFTWRHRFTSGQKFCEFSILFTSPLHLSFQLSRVLNQLSSTIHSSPKNRLIDFPPNFRKQIEVSKTSVQI